MSRSIFSNEAFADWLEKQPADDTYIYTNPNNCLICQYLRSTGMAVGGVVPDGWFDAESYPDRAKLRPLPRGWDNVSASEEMNVSKARDHWTYGKALARLRTHIKENAA